MNHVCPYCRTDFESIPDSEVVQCPGCGTPHHLECWQENGGCTVFGCRSAPAEEKKIRITVGELGVEFLPTPAGVDSTFAAPQHPLSYSPMPGTTPNFTGMPPTAEAQWQPPLHAKSRVCFILLGVFLGCFGIHNFYAGYVGRGVAQLALTLTTRLRGAFVTWIWAIVEVCVVQKDSRGVFFT